MFPQDELHVAQIVANILVKLEIGMWDNTTLRCQISFETRERYLSVERLSERSYGEMGKCLIRVVL